MKVKIIFSIFVLLTIATVGFLINESINGTYEIFITNVLAENHESDGEYNEAAERYAFLAEKFYNRSLNDHENEMDLVNQAILYYSRAGEMYYQHGILKVKNGGLKKFMNDKAVEMKLKALDLISGNMLASIEYQNLYNNLVDSINYIHGSNLYFRYKS